MKTQKILLSEKLSYIILKYVQANASSKEEILNRFKDDIDENGLLEFVDLMYENDIIVN